MTFREKAPLYKAILDMAVDAMPPPHIAQKYRIPKIWKGKIDSDIATCILNGIFVDTDSFKNPNTSTKTLPGFLKRVNRRLKLPGLSSGPNRISIKVGICRGAVLLKNISCGIKYTGRSTDFCISIRY